jgi:hypothetical protein
VPIFKTFSTNKCTCQRESGTITVTDHAQARAVLLALGLIVLGEMVVVPSEEKPFSLDWFVDSHPILIYFGLVLVLMGITVKFVRDGHKFRCALRRAALLLI